MGVYKESGSWGSRLSRPLIFVPLRKTKAKQTNQPTPLMQLEEERSDARELLPARLWLWNALKCVCVCVGSRGGPG